MSIMPIVRMGHPVLIRRAAVVADPCHPDVARLAADMIETMHAASGAGLAAPQVGVPLRLFVCHVPERRSEGPEDPPRAASVFCNPVLSPVDDEMIDRMEGCLSIPGLVGAVPRFARIRYVADGLDGRPVEGIAHGFFANVLQHEQDHLDGILYPMRITDFTRFGFADEMHARAESAPESVTAEEPRE